MMYLSLISDLSSTHRYQGLSVVLLLSCLWLGLSGIFDLLFGHYILGSSWDRFLLDYQARLRRILILFSLAVAIASLAIVWLGF
jgi:hypothetical protein